MYNELITNRINKVIGSKIAFFVGAGVSKNSEVPTFIELNEKIIQSIANGKLNDDECKLLSENIRPEVLLQIGIEELGSNVLESLEKLLGYYPNTNHVFLANAIERGNWVFTTNQENLIEEAYKEITGVEINRFRLYEDSQFEKFVKTYYIDENPSPKDIPGHLFKLHGTIEEGKEGKERFGSISVALNQVGTGLDENKKKVLRYFLENYDFCFVGYSCQDDFSIYPVLLNTNSEKSIFWFEWFEHAKEPISGLTWGKDRLQYEKEGEENKPPGEKRSLEIINVNNFLLKRENSLKFVGDSSEYIKRYVRNKLCSLREISNVNPSVKKRKGEYNNFNQWAKDIDEFKISIFMGRLFEHIQNWSEAEEYYKKAAVIGDKRGDKKQLSMAKQRLADLYYKQTIKSRENEAIKIYKGCIDLFKKPGNEFEVGCLKVDISNVLRRQEKENYIEAKDYAEEAEKQLEPIYLKANKRVKIAKERSIPIKDEDKKYIQGYARCLNVLGLSYWALGKMVEEKDAIKDYPESESCLKKGIKQCKESKEIKLELGDINGVAESDNAIGLILTEEGRWLTQQGKLSDRTNSIKKAKVKFNDAIKYLEYALKTGINYGFYRGCAQQCRNIGDVFRELMLLAQNKREIDENFQRAKDSYGEGIKYWKLIKTPPEVSEVGEILHYKQRIARLYVEFGELVQDIEQNRKLINLYNEIFENPTLSQEIKNNPKELKQAKEIIERTKKSFEEMNLYLEVEEINKIIKKINPEDRQ